MASLSIALTVILSLTAWWVINYIADSSKREVYDGIANNVEIHTKQLEGFFSTLGRTVSTAFSYPSLIEWLSQYEIRGSDISQDQQLEEVLDYLKQITELDNNIESLFFASAKTYEYFEASQNAKNNGRYDNPDYYVNVRPWWNKTIQKDHLYVGEPGVSYDTNKILTTIENTIKDKQQQLLGVVGVDISLTTMNKLLNDMNYRGQGESLLISDTGHIALFPDVKGYEYQEQLKLADLEGKIVGVSGLARLSEVMQSKQQGVFEIIWNGEPHLVSFNRVTLEAPKINWSLGLIVPKNLIVQPVNRVFWISVATVIGLNLVVVFIAYLVSLRTTRPLKQIVSSMNEIANGEGELSKRISIQQNNEIGKLSDKFNFFVEKIHDLIVKSRNSVSSLDDSTKHVNRLSSKSQKNALAQKEQLELIADSANELEKTIHNVNQSAENSSQVSDNAVQAVLSTQTLVLNSTSSIEELSKAVENADEVVKKVYQDSQTIREVLQVIESIAEQTNLLALNAAIEAARAGDQGRGFAVVADEVRSLASRTSESTKRSQEIIAELHISTNEAVEAMRLGQDKACIGVETTHKVKQSLEEIVQILHEVHQTSEQISASTTKQVEVSREITGKVYNVKDLADQTADQATAVSRLMASQNQIVEELINIMQRFRL